MIFTTTAFSTLVVCAWLSATAWQDLRTRQVANGLTLVPLLLAVALSAFRGDLFPLALLVLIVVIDSLPQLLRAGSMLIACTLAVCFRPELAVTPITWAAVYLLAQINVLGEADAKIAMTLIALFPTPVMAWCVAGAVFAVSLAATIGRHRLMTPWVLLGRIRDVLAFQFPEPAEMEEGVPVAGAFLLAFIAYLVYGVVTR